MNISDKTIQSPMMPEIYDGAEIMQVDIVRPQIDSLPNLVYSQIHAVQGVRELKMSLLIPRTTAAKPAVLYFPGGGFTTARHNKYLELRCALAEAGFVVAAAEYRTVPDVFPAPVVDGKAAVRYLRAHAQDYGIDPTRIAVLGDSAGGWMAQMLGTTNGEAEFELGDNLNQSSNVQAAATIYGISGLLNIGEGYSAEVAQVHASNAVTEALLVHGAAYRDFAGANIFSDPDKALYASPMGHIKGKKPPFLILTGTADSLVSPVQSAQLYQALKAEGNSVEYVLIEGAEHGDLHWYQPPVTQRIVDWFVTTLQSA